jgi:hypothetical protein
MLPKITMRQPHLGKHSSELLSNVLNLIVQDLVPYQMVPHLFAAKLIAINKKECCCLRTIAIGETLRRALGKCLLKMITCKLPFSPLQFGVVSALNI